METKQEREAHEVVGDRSTQQRWTQVCSHGNSIDLFFTIIFHFFQFLVRILTPRHRTHDNQTRTPGHH